MWRDRQEVGAMKKRMKELDPTDQGLKMNMTPMIDCTFLLLVFFMIVSEMSSLSLETISLPYADQANRDGAPGGRQLTINIRKDDARSGHVRVMGRAYDREKLAELIRKEAIRSGVDVDRQHPQVRAHNLRVLVRCDRGAKYEMVQWVFDACSRSGVYRTILAASPSTE
jgi:biopolymer transport protein ExbD